MGSFDSATFKERGQLPTFPVWTKAGATVVKKIPGGADNVIQKIGIGLPRMALVVRVSAAELTALYGKVGVTGSLVFGYETATAMLESIDGVAEQGAGHDVYFAALSLIRTSDGFSAAPSAARVTESDGVRVTESGDIRIVE